MLLLPLRFLVPLGLALEVVATLLLADAIGVAWTCVWLVGAFVLGVVVLRHAGSRAWAALRGMSQRPLTAEAGDTPLLFLAGLLLLVPGVLTDVLGLVLLTPPGRRVVKAALVRRFRPHVTVVQGTVARVRPVRPPAEPQAGELVRDDRDDDPHHPTGPSGDVQTGR